MARCENGSQETVTGSALLASKMLEFQSGPKTGLGHKHELKWV